LVITIIILRLYYHSPFTITLSKQNNNNKPYNT